MAMYAANFCVSYRTRSPSNWGSEYPIEMTANDAKGNSQAISSSFGMLSITFADQRVGT